MKTLMSKIFVTSLISSITNINYSAPTIAVTPIALSFMSTKVCPGTDAVIMSIESAPKANI